MVVQDASGFPVGSGEPALEGTWRFKYSGTWTTNGKNGWLPEYQVNETPLTSAQLAALNSGITDTAVTKLNGIEAGAEVNEIETVSVNGTSVTPDANKNVDIPIPDGVLLLDVDNHTLTEDELQAFKDAWNSRAPIFIHYGATGGQIVHPQTGNTLDWTQPQTFSAIMQIGNTNNKENPNLQGGQVVFTPSTMNLNFSWNSSSYLAMEGDSSLSTTANGNGWVKKSAIREALALKQNTLTFDSTPTENSTNPVTSGGVFSALASAGGIKTLTTDDYNYPVDNPTHISISQLTPGYYRVDPEGGTVAFGGNSSFSSYSYPFSLIVGQQSGFSTNRPYGYMFAGGSAPTINLIGTNGAQYNLVEDTLTSYDGFRALSASQGRVLNAKIGGNLSTLTTTDKTSLIAAINELVSRVSALEGN